jgi:hypothetical protein
MLSEIGDDDVVQPVARLLHDPELREDARAALERIPGKKSLAALQLALRNAPPGFKPAIAESLRVRGRKISECPSEKLVPKRPASGSVTAT